MRVNTAPTCRFGYPEAQLKDMWDEATFKKFMLWMRGQTFSSCDGSIFDHENSCTVDSNCGPHGYVYYTHDVLRFVSGKPAFD
jgi:hypothetical protein